MCKSCPHLGMAKSAIDVLRPGKLSGLVSDVAIYGALTLRHFMTLTRDICWRKKSKAEIHGRNSRLEAVCGLKMY